MATVTEALSTHPALFYCSVATMFPAVPLAAIGTMTPVHLLVVFGAVNVAVVTQTALIVIFVDA